jgi:hypothetical protein
MPVKNITIHPPSWILIFLFKREYVVRLALKIKGQSTEFSTALLLVFDGPMKTGGR